MVLFTTFVNGRICRNGEIVEGDQLVVSEETGKILRRTGYIGGEIIDLEDAIVAPGYLELQTNGLLGFHFTQFEDEQQYSKELEKVSKHLLTSGVTSFWATVPTVSKIDYEKILPNLAPRELEGASLLGAHVEGPYLAPGKKGCHNAELFCLPDSTSLEEAYGKRNLEKVIKLVTLAPELANNQSHIEQLSRSQVRISLGHSAASYRQGIEAVQGGAVAITHVFNAMEPLHHREPGLAGMISSNEVSPFYSLIADGVHVHPAVATMAYRANPGKCMLITDSVELAGLQDGDYPGHAQVSQMQRKEGSKVTIAGTETLIGSCVSLDKCVKNLVSWSDCSVAEAVRCVTENIADMMGLEDRGKLLEGRRADFVVLNDEGTVLETWVGGKRAWKRE